MVGFLMLGHCPLVWHHFTVRIAVCDPDAFYPLRSLVAGPFDNLEELPAIERFVRTVVLHDEIAMEITPWPCEPEADVEFTEEEKQAGGRTVITGVGPVLDGYDFFTDRTGPHPVPEVELSPALLETASQFANAGKGNVYFKAHVEYLKRLLGIVEQGGSLLLCDAFGQQIVGTARRYPEELFRQLDEDWQRYAHDAEQDSVGLLVPPVLGIVLTRCARRDVIPNVIRELRDEWADARKKVWELLDSLRTCRTLGEALEIRKELSEASRLFSPSVTDADTPVACFLGNPGRRCCWRGHSAAIRRQTRHWGGNERGGPNRTITSDARARIWPGAIRTRGVRPCPRGAQRSSQG